MAKKTVKQIKAAIKKSAKKAGFPKLEYNKDGTPKNWRKALDKVPMNRTVRLSDLPECLTFKNEAEKQKFLEQINAALASKNWNKELKDSVDQGVMQLEFSGSGEGRINDLLSDKDYGLGETQRIAARMNDTVQKINHEETVPGQVTPEAPVIPESRFVLPIPTAKIEEFDIPEYVLMGFTQPGNDFALESNINVSDNVRIVYRRGAEYFEAVITIGTARKYGRRCMEIDTKVFKDGATYTVTGIFCDHPTCPSETALDPERQPRAVKLYNFLCEKLGLN